MGWKPILATFLLPFSMHTLAATTQQEAIQCPFNTALQCVLQIDILNAVKNGERYYAPTNLDHRKVTTETNLHVAGAVTVTTPSTEPRRLRMIYRNNTSGQIMTRDGLTQPPWNAYIFSQPWTTAGVTHGYVELVVKLPSCTVSKDGKCEAKTNPIDYNQGLWPSIRLFPSNDINWPMNGEITLFEAYRKGSNYMTSDARLHFFGVDPKCENNDCAKYGYVLTGVKLTEPLFNKYHRWGLEWKPNGTGDGFLLTGYLDRKKFFGPIDTKTLPGDGPKAFMRGFTDPAGGYYLAVEVAVGGNYSGPINPQLYQAAMFINGIKEYKVVE